MGFWVLGTWHEALVDWGGGVWENGDESRTTAWNGEKSMGKMRRTWVRGDLVGMDVIFEADGVEGMVAGLRGRVGVVVGRGEVERAVRRMVRECGVRRVVVGGVGGMWKRVANREYGHWRWGM